MRFQEVLKKCVERKEVVYVSGIKQQPEKAIIIFVEPDWVNIRLCENDKSYYANN